MSETEFERVIAPVLGAVKHISYEEAIIVCNALGKLKTEIINLGSDTKRVKRVAIRSGKADMVN